MLHPSSLTATISLIIAHIVGFVNRPDQIFLALGDAVQKGGVAYRDTLRHILAKYTTFRMQKNPVLVDGIYIKGFAP